MKMKTVLVMVLALVVMVMSLSVLVGGGMAVRSVYAGDAEQAVYFHVKTEPEGCGSVALVTKTGEPSSLADFPEGSEVCFQVLPQEGCEMRGLWVKDAYGADVAYIAGDICSFLMPAADVLIRAVFEECKKAEVTMLRKDEDDAAAEEAASEAAGEQAEDEAVNTLDADPVGTEDPAQVDDAVSPAPGSVPEADEEAGSDLEHIYKHS